MTDSVIDPTGDAPGDPPVELHDADPLPDPTPAPSVTGRPLVLGLSPESRVNAPAESAFGRENFLPDDDLDKIVYGLIRVAPLGLGDLLETEARVKTRWLKKGSKFRGKPKLASVRKAAGLLAFEMKTDYVIEVAADQVRAFGLTHFQLEALIYRQLLEIKVDVDTDGNVTYAMRAPDVSAFHDELKHYGAWMVDLGEARESFRQSTLFHNVVSTFTRQRAAMFPEKPAKPETVAGASGTGRQTRSNGRRRNQAV